MIPYYSPNLSPLRIIKSFFQYGAEPKILSYFQKITNKKYILITSSCRTALYLAYRALGGSGEVITSPLTCKSAIDPITDAGFLPVFCDIRLEDLTMDPGDIEGRITAFTKAIQAIHLGGVACEMDSLCELAKKHNLAVIEDCAQGFGAKYKNSFCGYFGDIACFSLIKNAYGIGGGIFATNDKELFERARSINIKLKKSSLTLILFRLLRNCLATYRKNSLVNFLYKFVMDRRQHHSAFKKEKSVSDQLAQISNLELKVFAAIIDRLEYIHIKRQDIGNRLYDLLRANQLVHNTVGKDRQCSFSKLIIFNPTFHAPKLIELLDTLGIEAKHLENKYGVFYQEKLVNGHKDYQRDLPHYSAVHDHLISLPICEYFQDAEMNRIVEIVSKSAL